jgi:uroporphyrinogen decarboxylase
VKEDNKRISMMTDLECIKAMLNKEPPERVVYWEYCTNAIAAVQYGKTIKDAYTDPDFSYKTQKQISQDIGWLFHPIYPCLGADFGGEVKWPESIYAQAPAIVRYPVECENDISKLKITDIESLPSVRDGLIFSRLSAGEKLDNEPFNVTFSCAGPFTSVGDLCGLERLARWIIYKPELVHTLLRITTDYIVKGAEVWFKHFADTDILFLQSEPLTSNQIISPHHFEQFAFPYISELHHRVLGIGYRHIFCHICGDQNGNLPYWKQIPMGFPGIISTGPSIEIETAARYFPNDLIFGNLDPTIIQTGTSEDIYQAVRQVLLKGKNFRSRYIFGQGCEIPPRARKENMLAMVRAVKDFGWYE